MHAVYRLVLHPLLALLVLGLASVAGAADGRRVTLVVGNGAYAEKAAALPNPPNDARAVAGALRALGFEVLEATDLDHARLRATLGEFARRLEGAEAGLFFFTGHGLQMRGRNYLVPVDAGLEREPDVYVQTLALDDVLRLMDAAVPTRLVLLDACRNNPFTRSLARAAGGTRAAVAEQGLAKVEATAGTLIAYATAPDEAALDGAGPNSPFAAALVEYIDEPGLEARQVLTRVRGSVMEATNGRQVPWDSSSLTGDFYFNVTIDIDVRKEREPAPPPAFDRDSLFWQSIQASDDPADFEAYLAQFPGGIYAALTRNRLARLKASQQAALPPVVEAPPPAAAPPEQPPAVLAPSPEVIEAALGLSRGDWQRLQAALTALGFDTRGIDGRPGPSTRRAIAAWQSGKRQGATGYLAAPQRDVILSEAQPRLAKLKAAAPPGPSVKRPPGDTMAALPPMGAAGGYDGALDLLQQGRWAEAEKAFKAFLDANPNDQRASSAAYWLVKTYYFRKEYGDAAAAFARNYRAYGPDAPKAADNLLKLGMSLAALGQKDNACQTFAELARRHPNASVAVRQTLVRERAAAACNISPPPQAPEMPLTFGRQDEPAEVAQLRRAAEQGDTWAQVNLGTMYAQGQGVAKDEGEAVRWFRKAAEQGEAAAQYSLGVMYASGWGGLARDRAEAMRWYRKAAEQGNTAAKDVLARLGH